MFTEAQLYSPVTQGVDGTVTVHLGDNHPGLLDEAYRARRNEIAASAMGWVPGTAIGQIDYTDSEHGIWAEVSGQLATKHRQHAHAEYLMAKERLALPTDHVPQLVEVTDRLAPITGFTYVPAPGLVELREFYGSLADRVFHSTQYVRHPSEPLYTPEPDIIHEVIGHANQLASPRFAALTEAAGVATARAERDDTVQFIADVFWFTLEFGVMWQGTGSERDLKAYGAGILSSYGEMDEFAHMEIRPLDLAQMGTINYDITAYQPVLFAAESLEQLEDVVGTFFTDCDDDTPAKIKSSLATAC